MMTDILTLDCSFRFWQLGSFSVIYSHLSQCRQLRASPPFQLPTDSNPQQPSDSDESLWDSNLCSVCLSDLCLSLTALWSWGASQFIRPQLRNLFVPTSLWLYFFVLNQFFTLKPINEVLCQQVMSQRWSHNGRFTQEIKTNKSRNRYYYNNSTRRKQAKSSRIQLICWRRSLQWRLQ